MTLDEPDDPALDLSDRVPGGGSPSHRTAWSAAAAAVYLLLGVLVWWNVWRQGGGSTTTCGCGDASLFTWFLEWPAHALTHGLSPIYSTAMFHPKGVNLLANTSQVALGVLLAPVSWISGPVATLNVALTLSPALSAFAMFVLLRRWVTWLPAAFAGGLLYGFSPYFLAGLSQSHLMITMGPVPPLVVLLLDEMLVRQRWRAAVSGLILGLLLTLQFFIGTETLVITLVTAAAGVVLVVGFALVRHRDAVRARFRYAAIALGVTGATSLLLLAYPAWFALAGPAHLTSPIWPGFDLSTEAAQLRGLVTSTGGSSGLFGTAYNRAVGGYQGTVFSFQYLGVGLIVVLVAGLIVWRRDLRLWLFAAITAGTLALSLGTQVQSPAPWSVVAGLPFFDDIIPNRFLVMVYLGAAVLLGLIADHAYRSARTRSVERGWRSPGVTGVAAGLVAIVVALAPILVFIAPNVPLTAEPVRLPTWFRTVGPRLPGHQVLLVLPAPFGTVQASLTWQAVDRMHFSMVGGGGPGGVPTRAGAEAAGQAVLAGVTHSFLGPASIGPTEMAAVHSALVGWGVDKVVMPDEAGLAPYDLPQSVTVAAALVTAATGSPPERQAGAWVWSDVRHRVPAGYPGAARFSACTRGLPSRGSAAVVKATACILADSG